MVQIPHPKQLDNSGAPNSPNSFTGQGFGQSPLQDIGLSPPDIHLPEQRNTTLSSSDEDGFELVFSDDDVSLVSDDETKSESGTSHGYGGGDEEDADIGIDNAHHMSFTRETRPAPLVYPTIRKTDLDIRPFHISPGTPNNQAALEEPQAPHFPLPLSYRVLYIGTATDEQKNKVHKKFSEVLSLVLTTSGFVPSDTSRLAACANPHLTKYNVFPMTLSVDGIANVPIETMEDNGLSIIEADYRTTFRFNNDIAMKNSNDEAVEYLREQERCKIDKINLVVYFVDNTTATNAIKPLKYAAKLAIPIIGIVVPPQSSALQMPYQMPITPAFDIIEEDPNLGVRSVHDSIALTPSPIPNEDFLPSSYEHAIAAGLSLFDEIKIAKGHFLGNVMTLDQFLTLDNAPIFKTLEDAYDIAQGRDSRRSFMISFTKICKEMGLHTIATVLRTFILRFIIALIAVILLQIFIVPYSPIKKHPQNAAATASDFMDISTSSPIPSLSQFSIIPSSTPVSSHHIQIHHNPNVGDDYVIEFRRYIDNPTEGSATRVAHNFTFIAVIYGLPIDNMLNYTQPFLHRRDNTHVLRLQRPSVRYKGVQIHVHEALGLLGEVVGPFVGGSPIELWFDEKYAMTATAVAEPKTDYPASVVSSSLSSLQTVALNSNLEPKSEEDQKSKEDVTKKTWPSYEDFISKVIRPVVEVYAKAAGHAVKAFGAVGEAFERVRNQTDEIIRNLAGVVREFTETTWKKAAKTIKEAAVEAHAVTNQAFGKVVEDSRGFTEDLTKNLNDFKIYSSTRYDKVRKDTEKIINELRGENTARYKEATKSAYNIFERARQDASRFESSVKDWARSFDDETKKKAALLHEHLHEQLEKAKLTAEKKAELWRENAAKAHGRRKANARMIISAMRRQAERIWG